MFSLDDNKENNGVAIKSILALLKSLGLSADDSLDRLVNSPKSRDIYFALYDLRETDFLSKHDINDIFDLLVNSSNPSIVPKVMVALNDFGLLSRDFAIFNCNTILNHKRQLTLLAGIGELKTLGLLSADMMQANFYEFVSHEDPMEVVHALNKLKLSDLLAEGREQFYFDMLVKHKKPGAIASSMVILSDIGLLSGDNAESNLDVLLHHQFPYKLFLALSDFGYSNLFKDDAQASFNAISSQNECLEVARALDKLQFYGLLSGTEAQVNRDFISSHPNPMLGAAALVTLSGDNLLDGPRGLANRNSLYHDAPILIAMALVKLNNNDLLDGDIAQINRDLLALHNNPSVMANLIILLNAANLFTGDLVLNNFHAVRENLIVFTNVRVMEVFNRIPNHLFTQNIFDEMVNICQQNAVNLAIHLVVNYVNHEILHIDAHGQNFNTSQSTHTASVHDSVSKSAANLWQRYMNEGLETARREFANWLTQASNSNSDSLKIAAANRCFLRITSRPYHFVDSQSRVSTKDLLSLLWIGIHDTENMVGSVEDGQLALIEGLYECQRGYNLSELGEDDGAAADASICVAGTFNKLLEKMVGRLQDVEVIYLTMEGFSCKLPKVVRDEAVDYLQGLHSAERKHLLAEIASMGNTVKPIWSEIKAVVQARMLDEFGSLFVGDKEPLFLEYIEYCEHTEFVENDLTKLIDDRAESVAEDRESFNLSLSNNGSSMFSSPSVGRDEKDIDSKDIVIQPKL